MITINEAEAVWSVIGKLGAFIGVLVAIVTGFKYLWNMMPTSKLEQRVKEIEEHDKSDFEKLKSIESRINTLESRLDETRQDIANIEEGIERIGKSQISMLRHMADGNGVDALKQEADNLTEFFIER